MHTVYVCLFCSPGSESGSISPIKNTVLLCKVVMVYQKIILVPKSDTGSNLTALVYVWPARSFMDCESGIGDNPQ
jgi:hypothetical protein